MLTVASLAASPNALWPHYRAFRVAERLLLTGHSHQAWPDVARVGLLAAFDDAAAAVDHKWERAFDKAARVRAGFATLLGDDAAQITLTQNTHDAVVRLLSALPLRDRPRVVTTDGEFHSLDRQLRRLAEEGVEVVRAPAAPVDTLAERLITALQAAPERTALIATSSVLFQTAELVPDLPELARACDHQGVPLLLDVYHHLGAVPFSLRGLERAFITGGGYKYLQLGEGCGFLRVPASAGPLRPVVTGWFAAYGRLDAARTGAGPVPYDDGPARFGGSTYDPSSHYRAAAVLDFFAAQGLTPELLRDASVHQTRRLRDGLAAAGLLEGDRGFELAAPADPARVAGFLALRTPAAAAWARHLAARGVLTDARGEILRLGPAPYLSDEQLDEALAVIADVAREISPA